MIAGVTGGKAQPPEIAEQIIDRTDGVRLFVEELTKAVVESSRGCGVGATARISSCENCRPSVAPIFATSRP
jgi:hypothetical protein